MHRPFADDVTRAAATEIWLIRHGQSTGNRDGILQGQADHPLSPFGHEQAKRLATRLTAKRFDALYSSDLSRAHETAEYLVQVLGQPIKIDAELREIDVGAWAGLNGEQVAERFPDEWDRWIERDPTLRRGGGESYEDAQIRIVSALNAIALQHPGGRIAVVSHGGVIRAYLAHLLGLDLRMIWHLALINTAICRTRPFVLVMGGKHPRQGRVEAINDHAHLEGLKLGGMTPLPE